MRHVIGLLIDLFFSALAIAGIAVVVLGFMYVVGVLYAWTHGSMIITYFI
jgi:hypothetical protein